MSFLGGSETSAVAWESRIKREALAWPASSRHSRTTALILPPPNEFNRTDVPEETRTYRQACTLLHTLADVGPKGLGLGKEII